MIGMNCELCGTCLQAASKCDGFLEIAPKIVVVTTTHVYLLEKANDAFSDLPKGKINGATVLVPTYGNAVSSAG